MFKWKKINSIQDEEIIKFLGSNLVAFRDEGYFTTHDGYDLYAMVVGNGVIIQIHNCSYIFAVVKNNTINSKLFPDSQVNRIYAYAVKEVRGSIDEKYWLEKYRELLERDFGSKGV